MRLHHQGWRRDGKGLARPSATPGDWGWLGTAGQSNVVNLESGIGLQHARGRARAQAAEGARNPKSGAAASRDCSLSNRELETAITREKAATHVSSEGRQSTQANLKAGASGDGRGRPRKGHSGAGRGATKETTHRIRVSTQLHSLEAEVAGGAGASRRRARERERHGGQGPTAQTTPLCIASFGRTGPSNGPTSR